MRNSAYRSLTDQQLTEIDELCDRFDQELVKGLGPSMEKFLAEASMVAQDGLLAELLVMELEYRAKHQDEPQQEEYMQRFPEQGHVIASAFERGQQAGQSAEIPATASRSAIEETLLSKSSDAGDLRGERASGEAAFRNYLKPTTREGWLGRLGHYEIEKVLGRGAFGIVARAFDEKLHRVVAIKLMCPELATTSPPRKRFLREARTAAAVTHENVVAVYAVEEEPIPYLAMEYIAGQTLEQRMDNKGPLEAADVLRIGQQVAAGLAAAHAVHLIHRDIKPSNILLTDGAVEKAKISDFGLARAVDDASMTSSGLIAGTPMYMAPEQARGETLDHRADLFSLGTVLYQMAAGRPLFRAANTVAVLKRVCEDTPRPLDDVIPETPDWLQSIIFRLLEKNREDRFQSAQEVADLLARCQRELEHGGKVVSVANSRSANSDLTTSNETTKSAWPKPRLMAVLLSLAVLLLTVVGPKLARRFDTPIPALPQAEIITASGSPAEGATTTWHDWPTDAPQPAIAPFNADRAKQHQEAWAKHLGVPVEYENSIGMKFRLVPPGEFLMGSTPEEIEAELKRPGLIGHLHFWRTYIESEGPPHKVVLTKPIYVGVTEVTQSQYEQVMGTNPSHFSATGEKKDFVANLDTSNYPVEMVSWYDATEFCAKLSQQEKLKPFNVRSDETVTTLEGTGYRLPREAEWEFACRAGTTTRFWSGDKNEDLIQVGWCFSNAGGRTHSASELKANPIGLSDLHGNVWEWVQDGLDPEFYGQFQENVATDPFSPLSAGSKPMRRGGSFMQVPELVRSSSRLYYRTDAETGFRVVLLAESLRVSRPSRSPQSNNRNQTDVPANSQAAKDGSPTDAPPPAIAPFNAYQAKAHQQAWAKHLGVPVEYENSIGMKFRLVPPGEFQMGSTPEEIEAALKLIRYPSWRENIESEGPRHKVVLTKPIYVGVIEVTQAQYEQVMGTNPSNFSATGSGKDAVANLDTGDLPVETVSWNDAVEFCSKLSQQEQRKPFYLRSGETVSSLEGTGYRLPTDAEWEYACRAGTTTWTWIGDDDRDLNDAAWSSSNGGGRTHAVGELKPNPFGLWDVYGNVFEWVQDGWDPKFSAQFQEKIAIDPSSPFQDSSHRPFRGGDWNTSPNEIRSSFRLTLPASHRPYYVGFRVVLVVGTDSTTVPEPQPAPLPTPDRAVSFVESLGGKVIRDDNSPDKPVTGISLYGNQKLTDESLKELAPLQNLNYLNIGYSQVTDTGLKQLERKKGQGEKKGSGAILFGTMVVVA